MKAQLSSLLVCHGVFHTELLEPLKAGHILLVNGVLFMSCFL